MVSLLRIIFNHSLLLMINGYGMCQKKEGYVLRPLSWITVGCIVIGLIFYIYLQFFTDMTVQKKFWFILGTSAWGIVCIFLTVWSFFDYYK